MMPVMTVRNRPRVVFALLGLAMLLALAGCTMSSDGVPTVLVCDDETCQYTISAPDDLPQNTTMVVRAGNDTAELSPGASVRGTVATGTVITVSIDPPGNHESGVVQRCYTTNGTCVGPDHIWIENLLATTTTSTSEPTPTATTTREPTDTPRGTVTPPEHPEQYEHNWTDDRIIKSLNSTDYPDGDYRILEYVLDRDPSDTITEDDGRIVIHILNDTSGRITAIKEVSAVSDTRLWIEHPADKSILIYQVVETDRRLLVAGDFDENGLNWTRDASVQNVSDRAATMAAANITPLIADTSTSGYSQYRVAATGVPANGTVVAEFWGRAAGRSESFFVSAVEVPESVITISDQSIRVYYVHGDERRLLTWFRAESIGGDAGD